MCFVDGIAFSDFELWAALIRSDQLPQQEVPRFFKPILSSPVGIVSSTCHSSTSCPTEPTKLPVRPARLPPRPLLVVHCRYSRVR
jgi:hypothetical protein